MLIVEENHSYNGVNGVIGNKAAPYINGLAQQYLSATSWYAPFHGSPMDYMALLAGNNDGSLTPGKQSNDTTLVDELASKGISWGAYMEAMQTSCNSKTYTDPASQIGLYVPDHNPFLYYVSTSTPAACQNNVPVGQPSAFPDPPNDPFTAVMNSNSLPDFMFVVPDNCDEMHSECPANGNNEPGNADAWMANNMPAIQASAWYKQGGIVIITWDEAFHTDDSGWLNGVVCPSSSNCGGGNIPTIVVSAADATLSNHNFTAGGNLYGILRGIEEEYGVPLLSDSASTGNGDLKPAFGPTTTGAISGTVTDATASGNPPIAGVSVTCTCQTGGTMTNGSGGYSFINEPPGTNYSLTFTDAGYVTGTISGVNVTAGSTTPESIALTEDGSISGTVTDATASGNPPIAGVSVTCTCQTGAATTSGTGTYSFANIAPGTSYSMTFTDPSYVTDTISPVVVTAGSPTTESPALTEDGGSITGTVTDGTASGNPPIAGVSVTCTCQTGGTMTNGSGGYSFINEPPGTNYSLTFTDAGYATDTVSPVVVTAGTLTTQNVALTEDGSISGTVTEPRRAVTRRLRA